MAEDKAQEKTEQPTPKRWADSRQKGQVPRSRELTTMAVLLSSAGAMLVMGDNMIEGILDMMRDALNIERNMIMDTNALTPSFLNALQEALLTFTPFIILLVIIAFASPMALSGWSFSVKAFAFKWDKLDPVKGMGRVFSLKGLMELVKALVKFSLVLLVALILLWSNVDELLALGTKTVMTALSDAGNILGWSFLALSCSMILIAVVDVPFQLWEFTRQLKMTRQEVKDEYKETEGKPELKRRVREDQREISQRRMMDEIPNADVVITNPTHYAVALRYDQDNMTAPVLVAKGKGMIAAQIRTLAVENEVPIISAPPLSRALFHTTELQEEIPAGLFLAVAQVLAYTYQLRTRSYRNGDDVSSMNDLSIPEDMKYDS